jgi:hypothetical protein
MRRIAFAPATPAALLASALLGAVLAAGPEAAAADATDCRLALVLALDVSSSVDAGEDRLQRIGLASALRSPEVASAILSSPGSVALYAFEWSGSHHQSTILDWTTIDSPADLAAAAGVIAGSVRQRDDLATAIGPALGHAATALARGPNCLFRKVDVSGDGASNDGYLPAIAYDAFDFSDIVVNGLVILGASGDSEIDLAEYYAAEVLHGPGAFLEVASDFDDFARAIRRKLVRELVGQTLSLTDPPASAARGLARDG